MENNDKKFDSVEKADTDVSVPAEAEISGDTNAESPKEVVMQSDSNYDADMWITSEPEKPKSMSSKVVRSLYDFVETLAIVTIVIVLCFAFVFRLNIVDGSSMENTLFGGEYLFVSDVLYTPTQGDIVVVQDLTNEEYYRQPIVKRVIATEGQTVEIDYNTWTVKVDGEIIDEDGYRYLDPIKSKDDKYPKDYRNIFTTTVEEGHVFVMGDNRRNSADSRVDGIGQIDERCIVGKVYARVFPFDKFTIFKNPFQE